MKWYNTMESMAWTMVNFIIFSDKIKNEISNNRAPWNIVKLTSNNFKWILTSVDMKLYHCQVHRFFNVFNIVLFISFYLLKILHLEKLRSRISPCYGFVMNSIKKIFHVIRRFVIKFKGKSLELSLNYYRLW